MINTELFTQILHFLYIRCALQVCVYTVSVRCAESLHCYTFANRLEILSLSLICRLLTRARGGVAKIDLRLVCLVQFMMFSAL